MRNANEPDRKTREETRTREFTEKTSPQFDADVIPFEPRPGVAEGERSLLPKRQVELLHSQWNAIQTNFVDEPRKAVEDADKLVASAIKQLEESFSAQRASLEKRWSHGDDVSTEDLRICLQHYPAFVSRLSSM